MVRGGDGHLLRRAKLRAAHPYEEVAFDLYPLHTL